MPIQVHREACQLVILTGQRSFWNRQIKFGHQLPSLICGMSHSDHPHQKAPTNDEGFELSPMVYHGDRAISDLATWRVQWWPEILHNNVRTAAQNSDEDTKENQLQIAGSVQGRPDNKLLDGFQPRSTWKKNPLSGQQFGSRPLTTLTGRGGHSTAQRGKRSQILRCPPD